MVNHVRHKHDGVGAVLQISAFSRLHMIVGRIVAGIGNGINTATVSKRSDT
jgi:hypothetical protein